MVLISIPFPVLLSQAINTDTPRTSGIPPINPLANPKPDGIRLLEDSMHEGLLRKRLELINQQRHKEMNEDTAKLVALAREVKSETDHGSSDQLSVVELRKVEQIEKLARAVQNKMTANAAN